MLNFRLLIKCEEVNVTDLGMPKQVRHDTSSCRFPRSERHPGHHELVSGLFQDPSAPGDLIVELANRF